MCNVHCGFDDNQVPFHSVFIAHTITDSQDQALRKRSASRVATASFNDSDN